MAGKAGDDTDPGRHDGVGVGAAESLEGGAARAKERLGDREQRALPAMTCAATDGTRSAAGPSVSSCKRSLWACSVKWVQSGSGTVSCTRVGRRAGRHPSHFQQERPCERPLIRLFLRFRECVSTLRLCVARGDLAGVRGTVPPPPPPGATQARGPPPVNAGEIVDPQWRRRQSLARLRLMIGAPQARRDFSLCQSIALS